MAADESGPRLGGGGEASGSESDGPVLEPNAVDCSTDDELTLEDNDEDSGPQLEDNEAAPASGASHEGEEMVAAPAGVPGCHEIVLHTPLLRRPQRPDGGPQTQHAVLVMHEAARKRARGAVAARERGFESAQVRMHQCANVLVHVCASDVSPLPPRLDRSDARGQVELALLVASHVTGTSRLQKLARSVSQPAGAPRPPSRGMGSLGRAHYRATHPRQARCLRSIAAQRGGAPSLVLLSWSVGDAVPHLRVAVRNVVRDCAIRRLSAIEQPRPCAQFEHYHILAAAARRALGLTRAQAWVCFADDDDMLHPHRSAAFAAAIARAPIEARAVDYDSESGLH